MMGFLIAVAILWFAFGRWRRRIWARGACMGRARGGSWRMHGGEWPHGRHYVPMSALPDHAETRRGVPREAALESLKRRYVAGELSDEDYERELDTLFRATSGRGRA